MSEPIEDQVTKLVSVVLSARLPLSDEKATQNMAEKLLTGAGIPFEREKRLAAGEIVDFLVNDAIAVEIKLNSAKRSQIMRQLERYASHDTVKALVLVTNRAISLPRSIDGKPAYFVSLGRAWI